MATESLVPLSKMLPGADLAAGYDDKLTVQGNGPAIVLVPGMDGTGDLFHRQVPPLARSYRVATYALRDTTDRMAVLVDDLADVIQRVAPDDRRAIVLGESFGGTLALSLGVTRPEHVAALVVLNSFPFFAPQRRLRLAIAGLLAMPWGAMPVVRRITASRLHSPHTHRSEIRAFIELTKRATRRGYLNRLRILRGYDVRPRLREIACPALFLASEHDHLVPSVPEARLMASEVPGADLQILEGHGHICLIAPGLDLERILTTWLGERALTSAGNGAPVG